MADEQQPGPLDGLTDHLQAIERKARDALDLAAQAASADDMRTVWEDLYGPPEDRRREHNPGLVAKVSETRRLAFDLATARDESEAVKDFKRWMVGIGLTVIATMIAAVGLMFTLVRSL